jgi:hypothetical protein
MGPFRHMRAVEVETLAKRGQIGRFGAYDPVDAQ